MLLFDASVDLTEHNIPPGMPPTIAVERAREALGALTGVGWVSVEWCGEAPAEASWARAYKGSGHESALSVRFARTEPELTPPAATAVRVAA